MFRFEIIFPSILLLSLLVSSPSYAELKLAKIFSDHMVLQRDAELRIWGSANAQQSIEVCLVGDCYKAKADSEGAWQLSIPPLKAAGPLTIRVSAADESVQVKDVYVGDVWLAGGQSNMEWKLSWGIDQVEEEYADAEYPLIRFFEVDNRVSAREEEQLEKGHWQMASRDTVENFSAIAWLFAKKNHRDKNVAVGIIDNNWGGTPAEAWVSENSIAALSTYAAQAKEKKVSVADWPKIFAQNEKKKEEKYRRLASKEDTMATGAFLFDYDVSAWKKINFPSSEKFEHLAWLRKEFHLDSLPQGEAILDFDDLKQEAFIFVNEKLIAVEDWQVVGSRHVLPDGLLRKGKNLIALRLGSSWNNHPELGESAKIFLQREGNKMDLTKGWVYSNTVEAPLPHERRFELEPSNLYNAMISPIRRFAMRGVIWYQGESNVGLAVLYGDLFKTLIRDWRQATAQPLPFLFVQLAGFLKFEPLQANSSWAELRYQQSLALELPLTGMATAFDIGEEFDVHPGNKQDVAARLWLQARKVAFGEKVQADAPRLVKAKLRGNRAELSFDAEAGKLRALKGNEPLPGFIIAGEDRVFYLANAELKGNKVYVWSEKVSQPKVIKYAWNDFPKVNLYSEAGLPVLPFEIEQF